MKTKSLIRLSVGLEDRLQQFAVNPRSATKLLKTSKLNPLAIRKNAALGEFRVAPKGAAVDGPLGYFTGDIQDARGTAADLLRRKRKGQDVGFDAVLESYDFARGDRLGKMVGAKAPVVFRNSNLSRGVAAKMRKVHHIDAIKGPNLKAAMQPQREKVVKGLRGNLKDVVAKRRAVFNEDADTWRGSIGTAVPRGAKKHYGLESILERHNFNRARDGGGRYAPGNMVSADDMAAAYGKSKVKETKKKAMLVGAGVAGVAGAAAIGSKVAPRLTAGLGTGMGRLVRGAVR